MADDFTSDRNTTGSLTAGGTASGTLEVTGDRDWFRISLAANSYYTFKLSGSTQTSAYHTNFDLGLAPPGQGIQANPFYIKASESDLTCMFKTGAAGDYYLTAGSWYGLSGASYALSASVGTVDVVGDTKEAAASLALGIKVAGVFEGPADVDMYKVALTAGTTYKISSAVLGSGISSGQLGVSMTDANGQAVSLSGSSGTYAFTPAVSGNYYVAARNNPGPTAEPLLRDYTLQVERGPDDYSANAAGAGLLTVGGVTKGKLETTTDKDWYAVSLNAGTTYWFTAKADSTGGLNTHAAALKLYDAASQTVASASGYNSETVLQFVPAKSGIYYFEVGDTSSYYTGNYVASAAIGTPDDFGSDKATASALSVGTTVSGKLEMASDQDVFKFAVKAGTTYTFELRVQNSVGSPSLYFSGVDGSGSGSGAVSYSKEGATSYRVYNSNYTGDYFLTVDNNYSTGTAGYTLAVSTPVGDDFTANSSTTGLLAIGGKLTGELSYIGDSDWIKVKLVAGNKYAFVLDGKASGGGTLELANGEAGLSLVAQSGYGSYLSAMSGIGGKGYTVTADLTGDYYLAVTPSSYGGYARTGSYTVSSYSLAGDSAMPTLLSVTPGNGSAGASLTGNITLTFDDLMRGGEGSVRLINAEGNVVEAFSTSSSRLQINGKVVTIDPTSMLQPGTKYTLELPAGSFLDYAGNKFLADRVYTFSTLDTVAQGGSGNDFLSGIGTNVRLSGGDGVDSVIYGSSYANYTVSRGATETKVLYRGGGSQGSGDILTGVERLQFSDRSIALDVDGNGGQAYRLYQAAFNRTPDKSGLGFWMAQMDKGLSLSAVAESFLGSSEFQSMFGVGTSNEVFIGKLYQNVLHRAGDAAGVDYWSGVLAGGTPRAELLKSFSEGTENSAEILKLIGAGFEYTPYG